MIIGIDHANIVTDKLAETRAFFLMLGLKDGPRPNFAGFKGAWLYAGDAPVVHLVDFGQARPASAGAIDHFSLAVDDFEATLAHLDAKGVPYRAVDIPDGFGRQAFVKDPNGVTVELTWRPGR